MENDDVLVGRVLSRREALALMGVTGVTILTGCSDTTTAAMIPEGACVVRPELTEGPYFVDELLNRSDIRSDPSDGSIRPGTPLDLTFNLSGIFSEVCSPVPGLFFDIWHCDAGGVYSDVTTATGKKFLRGYQVSDANGQVKFTTIYPGWYSGRAVHIHFKIRSALTSSPAHEFTSQLFFTDAFSDQVYLGSSVYTKGSPDTRNAQDSIYGGGGAQLLLAPAASNGGYAATMDIGLADVEVPVERTTWGLLKNWGRWR